MAETLLENNEFLRSIFNAVPSMLLVVDDDVRILHVNAAAAKDLGLDITKIFRKRGGEALHCLHADDVAEGCGRAPACKECILRGSVGEAIRGGTVRRRHARMELRGKNGAHDIHLLITTSSFVHEKTTYVLMALEDINELIQLKSLLPICSGCKKIRNDDGYWKEIAEYFSSHLDIEFSHGLCRDCAERLYPEYTKQKDAGPGLKKEGK